MLGAVLDRISKVLPSSFLISAFYPMLFAAFVNGALLYHNSDVFYLWVRGYPESRYMTLISLAVLIGISFLAYVLSLTSTLLREILEGRHWPRWLRREAAHAKQRQLRRLNEEILASAARLRALRKLEPEWQRRLVEAKTKEGPRIAPGDAVFRDPASVRALEQLRRDIATDADSVPQIAALVGLLETELAEVDATHDQEDNALARAHKEALLTFEDAVRRAQRELVEKENRRQFGFGRAAGGGGVVAPTDMGNVALSINSYALSRYGLNLTTFWTRFQKALNGQPHAALVQQAKMQVDFLIAVCWLTSLTSGLWILIFAVRGDSLISLVIVGGLGPLVAVLSYGLAVENYKAYADLIRSAVDLYRFQVLRDLRVAEPGWSAQEKSLWAALDQVSSYGGDVGVKYTHSE